MLLLWPMGLFLRILWKLFPTVFLRAMLAGTGIWPVEMGFGS